MPGRRDNRSVEREISKGRKDKKGEQVEKRRKARENGRTQEKGGKVRQRKGERRERVDGGYEGREGRG